MMIDLMIAVAWKSALVGALGLGLAWLVRGRSAAARVALLRLAVVLMLVMPFLALLLPALRVETGAPPPPIVLPAVTSAAVAAPPPVAHAMPDGRLAFVGAYAAVAVLLLLRLALDIAALARLSRNARPVTDPAWRQALHRNAPKARLLVSDRVAAPLSWGFDPVILLNPAALERPADADAVLAHEAGHIHRRDWLFLILGRAAAAVFWFNPLVWWLNGELVQRSEEAVDAYAVARIDRAAYASALVGFAGAHTPRAANGMMRGGLKRRIGLILDGSKVRAAPLLTGLAGLACIAFATPLAAVELVHPAAKIIRLAFQDTVPVQAPPPAGPVVPPPAAPAVPAAPVMTGDDATVPDVDSASDDADAQQAASDAEQARQDALQAKQDAEQAQEDKDQAEQDRQQARSEAEQGKQQAEQDKAQAEQDKQQAELEKQAARAERDQARQEADAARAQALIDKHRAADQMDDGVLEIQKGAAELRDTAQKLRDPAYRAQQIAEAAARGETITDDHLQSLIPQFQAKADELDQRARDLQARAAEMRNGT